LGGWTKNRKGGGAFSIRNEKIGDMSSDDDDNDIFTLLLSYQS